MKIKSQGHRLFRLCKTQAILYIIPAGINYFCYQVKIQITRKVKYETRNNVPLKNGFSFLNTDVPLQLNLNCVKQDNQVIKTFQQFRFRISLFQGIGGLEGGLDGVGGGYLHLVSAKTPLIEVDSDRESCVWKFPKGTKRENMWRWGHRTKLWAWTLNENKWSLHHHRISYFNDEIRRIYWSLCVSNTNVFLYVWHQTIFLLSSIVKRSQNSLFFFLLSTFS